jgi:DHA2 family multidrug resistance protein-like MFS transporter
MLAPVVVCRLRPAFVMAGGLALAAIGFGMLSQVHGTSGLALLVTGSVVFSLGLAAVFTLAADMVVGTAPRERAGAASAILETSSELGGALGIAVLGSIGTAVYRSQVADAVPAGVPPQAAEAARDTLGGAVAAGDQLPDAFAAELLEAARQAFTQGLQLAATISAAVVIAAAVLAVVLLRRVGGGSEPEEQPDLKPDRHVAAGMPLEPTPRPAAPAQAVNADARDPQEPDRPASSQCRPGVTDVLASEAVQ